MVILKIPKYTRGQTQWGIIQCQKKSSGRPQMRRSSQFLHVGMKNSNGSRACKFRSYSVVFFFFPCSKRNLWAQKNVRYRNGHEKQLTCPLVRSIRVAPAHINEGDALNSTWLEYLNRWWNEPFLFYSVASWPAFLLPLNASVVDTQRQREISSWNLNWIFYRFSFVKNFVFIQRRRRDRKCTTLGASSIYILRYSISCVCSNAAVCIQWRQGTNPQTICFIFRT